MVALSVVKQGTNIQRLGLAADAQPEIQPRFTLLPSDFAKALCRPLVNTVARKLTVMLPTRPAGSVGS